MRNLGKSEGWDMKHTWGK